MQIGIDLGGTKIEGIVLNGDGAVLACARRDTPRGDYAQTLTAIAELVAEIDPAPAQGTPIGIGIPGTISPATGLVKNANSVWLIGQPLDRDLAKLTGREIRIANDANCFAMSEASDGAGTGADIVFGAILGTGVGGGLVIGGSIVTGANAVAGEWGHTPLPWVNASEWPGEVCYCGRHGCIETFLSGPGFARDYAAAGGRQMPAHEIAALAEAGDAQACAALDRYEDRLARALAVIVNILDPDVIVLGGGMSNIQRLYTNVPPLIGRHAFTDQSVTRMVPPRHGDSSGVRGAAWLWPAIQGK